MFDPLQSAYRDKHSTETALIKVQNDILSALDAGSSEILLMLDLSAAFDTIDHDILLSRLCTVYGITGDALDWFRSCLTGRIQRVVTFLGSQSCDPASWQAERQLFAGDIESNSGPKPTLKTLLHSLNPTHSLIHQSIPLNPPHPNPHLSQPTCPLCTTRPHTTEHLFNCTHLYTSNNILDLWMSPGRVVSLLARWKGRLAGLP